jgi:hypothetical protein
MDCRTALEILDRRGNAHSGPPDRDLVAAEAHLNECRRCRMIVQNRRRLDRKVGRVLRAVDVPRDAQERLLAQLVELEAAAVVAESPAETRGDSQTAGGVTLPVEAVAADHADLAQPALAATRFRRRMWPGLVPVAACLAVAAIGFFSVVWLMTPRWSVEEVGQLLAKVDFDSLKVLRNFSGDPAASRLPADPGWQKLDWRLKQVPKALPDMTSRHQFAVYGFVIPGRQHHSSRGLLAVIPRRQMRAPPADQSLSAAPSGGYLAAGIGDSVSVAWTEGDVVYVCLIEGGEDSLNTLRQILGPSAA